MSKTQLLMLLTKSNLPPQMRAMLSLALNAVAEKEFQNGFAVLQWFLNEIRTGDLTQVRAAFAQAGLPGELVDVLFPVTVDSNANQIR